MELIKEAAAARTGSTEAQACPLTVSSHYLCVLHSLLLLLLLPTDATERKEVTVHRRTEEGSNEHQERGTAPLELRRDHSVLLHRMRVKTKALLEVGEQQWKDRCLKCQSQEWQWPGWSIFSTTRRQRWSSLGKEVKKGNNPFIFYWRCQLEWNYWGLARGLSPS